MALGRVMHAIGTADLGEICRERMIILLKAVLTLLFKYINKITQNDAHHLTTHSQYNVNCYSI